MSSIARYLGVACCLIGIVLGVFNYLGRPLIGSVYTPFLLVGIGLLLLLRSKLTRS